MSFFLKNFYIFLCLCLNVGRCLAMSGGVLLCLVVLGCVALGWVGLRCVLLYACKSLASFYCMLLLRGVLFVFGVSFIG